LRTALRAEPKNPPSTLSAAPSALSIVPAAYRSNGERQTSRQRSQWNSNWKPLPVETSW
jgi:hypothetical protein